MTTPDVAGSRSDQGEGRRENRRAKRLFFMLALAAMCVATIQSVINPVLPTIQHAMGTDQGTVTWLATAYLVASAVCTPILGKMGDIWGKDKLLAIVLTVFALGCLLAAVAPNIGTLIAARVVQGVGGAIFPLSFGLIRDELPAERVGGAIGTLAALLAVGGGLGVVVAGPVVDLLGFEWLFLLPGAAAFIIAVGVRFAVRGKAPVKGQSLNLFSAVLLAGWLVALLIPISNASQWGWLSLSTLSSMAVAGLLVAVWVVVELRSLDPLVDLRLMRTRTMWVVNVVSGLFGACLFIAVVFLPQFFQTPKASGYGFGATMGEAGFLLLPLLVAMFLTGLSSGWVQRQIGARAQLIAASALMSSAGLLLVFAHAHAWQLIIAQVLIGISVASAFASSGALIVASVPSDRTAVASGVNVNFRTIGGAIGVSAVSTLVASHVPTGGFPTEEHYVRGFAVVAGMAFVATVLAPFVHQRASRRTGHRVRQEAAVEGTTVT